MLRLPSVGGEHAFGLGKRGQHDLVENARAGLAVFAIVVAGGAQDVGDRDAPAFARQFVAAARPPDPVEDAFVHQRLQHRLEMARRQVVARRKLARRNRPFARIERDVDYGCDGKKSLAGQK